MRYKRKKNVYDFIIQISLVLYALFSVLPVLLVAVVSISAESSIASKGFTLFPEKLSLDAYNLVFSNNTQIAHSYLVSIVITVTGTAVAVIITALAAFTLTNKSVAHRNKLALFFFIPMVFSAGLVPWYMVNNLMGLKNNIFALIIPYLIFNPFNLFLVRNYFNGIPYPLYESAKIDGANDFTVAFKIYFPVAKPVLAAITLFYALRYWNDWFNAIMLVDEKNLYPLQYLLFKLQSEIRMLEEMQQVRPGMSKVNLPTESLKMATVMITIGPIVFLYPFLQKYFIKGLIIGSVKG